MKRLFCILIITVLACRLHAQLRESVTWSKLNSHTATLPIIGQLKTTPSNGTGNSYWSIGCETLDRDYSDFARYRSYLKDLGVGYARIQSGWAKTEKVRGQYDFKWLDDIVDGLLEEGLKPWICLCYGNPLYASGTDLNARIFTDKATMTAWCKYVRATVKRYKGKVTMYEVWNEPDGGKGINPPENYGDLFVETGKAIRQEDKTALIAGFGICSPARTEYVKKAMERIQTHGGIQYLDKVTFHAYWANPDDVTPSILNLRQLLRSYSPRIELLQGESGCPSQLEFGHALKNREWTEYQQVKWDLRRMANDFKLGIPSSVFTFADLNYGWMLQSFGMIRMNLRNEPIYKRPSYHGVQHMASLFTTDITPDNDIKVESQCGKTINSVGLRKNGKTIGYMLWFCDDVPDASLEREEVSVIIKGANIHNIAYVDMVTGKVHDMSSLVVGQFPDNAMKLTNIPLWDAPVLIIEKNQINY